MKKPKSDIDPVGIIGLGLLGRGIATCLLSRGFSVRAYELSARHARAAVDHIASALQEVVRRKLVPRSSVKGWRERFSLVSFPEGFGDCPFVIESVREDLKLKRGIFRQLESAMQPRAVIASNTSSIPISVLQKGRRHPSRFIGMHWGEPAEILRYLEIIPGKQTSAETVSTTRTLGEACGKEPSTLNVDIRGFVSNRMMYAMMREAFYLVESGVADLETVDRSFRNDIGWWATLAGPFRWMDLTGIPAYATVAEGLFPKLSNAKSVSRVMRDVANSGANGVSNAKGFYKYSKAGAREWERVWVDFTYDIAALVGKYERRVKL
ncbi:MAG TPA: 3-hydroxyacyl-CoA dehydrogenase family protein [Bryobacteraceae bacterium]|nr:3-hydroxyacyl-CoA dehydrogenase family protein [Bryobacteraceae bacterium]